MDRITSSQIEHMALAINKQLGTPLEYFARDSNGDPVRTPRATWEIELGHYHISRAYGGVCLHRTDNEFGGVGDVFNCGHVPKRDLYNRMRGFLAGVEAVT